MNPVQKITDTPAGTTQYPRRAFVPVTREEEMLSALIGLQQQVLDELRGLRRDFSLSSAKLLPEDGSIELREPLKAFTGENSPPGVVPVVDVGKVRGGFADELSSQAPNPRSSPPVEQGKGKGAVPNKQNWKR